TVRLEFLRANWGKPGNRLPVCCACLVGFAAFPLLRVAVWRWRCILPSDRPYGSGGGSGRPYDGSANNGNYGSSYGGSSPGGSTYGSARPAQGGGVYGGSSGSTYGSGSSRARGSSSNGAKGASGGSKNKKAGKKTKSPLWTKFAIAFGALF